MIREVITAIALFAGAATAEPRKADEWWSRQRGITEGVLIAGSGSPDKKYALFEFHFWDGQTRDSATTATGIGLAPADRSRLLFLIDSRTRWMTDKNVTSFLTFKWNTESTLLATHDSGAKHSRLNIYRVSASGVATELQVPDLLPIAAKKLGISAATVSSSGQTPLKWRTARVVEVAIGMTTPKGKLSTTLPLSIDAGGAVSVE